MYIECLTHGFNVYIVRRMSPRPVKNRAKRTGPVGVHMNLPAELISTYDARVAVLNADAKGPQWTRTDLIRSVLTEAAKAWGEEQ